MGLGAAQALEERDDGRKALEATEVRGEMALDSRRHENWMRLVLIRMEQSDSRGRAVARVSPLPEVREGTPPAEPTPEVVDEPPEPTPEAYPAGSAPDIIAGVFGPYAADALAVAQCESTDYYAPGGYYHIGAFQLAFRYHAGKFAAHGWDMWAEGNDVYKNATVAYEIFVGRGYSWLGTSGWPVCGWRAGY